MTISVILQALKSGLQFQQLTNRQFAVFLCAARSSEEVPNALIRKDLGLSPAVMTRCIDSLIGLKLVERRTNDEGLRRAFIALTPKGREFAREVVAT